MGKNHTHYDNLKVVRDARDEVIRAAYKTLSQKYHPDRRPDDPEAERIMKIINRAYAVLSDPAQRRAHDAAIAAAGREAAGQQPTPQPPPQPAPRPQQATPKAAAGASRQCPFLSWLWAFCKVYPPLRLIMVVMVVAAVGDLYDKFFPGPPPSPPKQYPQSQGVIPDFQPVSPAPNLYASPGTASQYVPLAQSRSESSPGYAASRTVS
jgi:hypothetical protein